MTRTVGDDMAPQTAARQRKISQQIADLVTKEFVGEPKVIVHDALVVEHDRVLERRTSAEAPGAQGIGLVVEAECAGRGDLLLELRAVESEVAVLATDAGMVEVDGRRDAEARVRDRDVRTAAASLNGRRLGNLDRRCPAAVTQSTLANAWLHGPKLPSRMGNSDPSSSTTALSTPHAASAASRCSTVRTSAPAALSVVPSSVLVTNSTPAGISGSSATSMRRNTMPVPADAGLMRTFVVSPVWMPIPANSISCAIVRWFSLSRAISSQSNPGKGDP